MSNLKGRRKKEASAKREREELAGKRENNFSG
jgi:hypothetical protein